MKITAYIDITRNKSTDTYTLSWKGTIYPYAPQEELKSLYNKTYGLSDVEKQKVFDKLIADGLLPYFASSSSSTGEKVATNAERIAQGIENLVSFFSEFQFSPNFRFLNSLGNRLAESNDKAVDYVINYFRLVDSPYATEIMEKVKSAEFKGILADIALATPTKVVNDRLKVYFGTQGTGKTTKALAETGNLCVVCNSSMLPADLMEDFTFDDGKATFHPSALARCMEEGKPIVLDEMNLLPFDSLRFLQGIFDGKKEFQYKGNTIHINDGFKVIGTMNLVVNGVAFGLPEPLVDRCSSIEEFKLTPDMLMSAF